MEYEEFKSELIKQLKKIDIEISIWRNTKIHNHNIFKLRKSKLFARI